MILCHNVISSRTSRSSNSSGVPCSSARRACSAVFRAAKRVCSWAANASFTFEKKGERVGKRVGEREGERGKGKGRMRGC